MGGHMTHRRGGDRDSIARAFQPGQTICFAHQTTESTTAMTYLVCLECGHAYQTADELMDVFNELVITLLNATKPEDAPPLPYESDMKKMTFCPYCSHDFWMLPP